MKIETKRVIFTVLLLLGIVVTIIGDMKQAFYCSVCIVCLPVSFQLLRTMFIPIKKEKNEISVYFKDLSWTGKLYAGITMILILLWTLVQARLLLNL